MKVDGPRLICGDGGWLKGFGDHQVALAMRRVMAGCIGDWVGVR